MQPFTGFTAKISAAAVAMACLCVGLWFINSVAAFTVAVVVLTGLVLYCAKRHALDFEALKHTQTSQRIVNEHVAIIHTTETGEVRCGSICFAELMGVDVKSLKGEHLSHFVGTGSAILLDNAMQGSQELQYFHQDKAVWAEVSRGTYDDGYVFFFTDITDKKRVEELSLTDTLTGLKNQRAFDMEIDTMIKRAQRQENYLTLAVIDIDCFKDYNDAYGHPEGDKALRVLAESMRETLRRPTDHFYRIGGDEFVVVFENDPPTVCKRALQKLNVYFEDRHLPQPNTIVSPFMTVSIGAFGAKGMQLNDSEHLYMNADVQLYKAKENRNTFCGLFPDQTQELCVAPLAKRLEGAID